MTDEEIRPFSRAASISPTLTARYGTAGSSDKAADSGVPLQNSADAGFELRFGIRRGVEA